MPDSARPPIDPDSSDVLLVGRHALDDSRIGGAVTFNGTHAVLFGPSGAGKGMRIITPMLLSAEGRSFVVVDTKAQQYLITAKFRHQIGDKVCLIDPFGVVRNIAFSEPQTYRYLIENGLTESMGFNALSGLDPSTPTFYDVAAIKADAMIKVQGNDPHWTESAQGLVAALMMWEKKRNGKNANLENVRAMLTEADAWETYFDEGAGKNRERLVAGLSVTAARMVEEGGFEIASLAGRFMSDAPTDEMESVRSTADTQTRWLLSQPVREDLKKDGVDFRELKHGDRPLIVYIVLPPEYLEAHSIWLRLVVSEALRASMTPGGRRVTLLLDEFAALGHFSIVERFMPVARDFKVGMYLILQYLPQLKGLYKDRWETLLGTAGLIQSFRAADLTTAEWLSKRAGSTTVVAASFQGGHGTSSAGPSTNNGLAYQQVERPNIPYDNMFDMKDGHKLAWFTGQHKPLSVFAPLFTNWEHCSQRALPNPYFDK